MDAVAPQQLPFDTQDAQRCRTAVASLPITNVVHTQNILHTLLTSMRKSSPPARDYLEVLEAARAPLAFVQDEASRRYASRPLPPNEGENEAFERVLDLWHLMAGSYAHAAQIGGGDPEVRQKLALICQRCIHYAGLVLIESFRARRAPAQGFWLDLHGYYDTAEEWGLATQPVGEPLGGSGRTVTCAETYAVVLLADLANPYNRTPGDLVWILRWAHRFAPRTAIEQPDEDAGGRGYGIDLMEDRGVRPVENLANTRSARLFDTSRLGPKLQKVLASLKRGASPASLGLGKECPPAHASRLLLHLYRPWCLAAVPRRFERRRAAGSLFLTCGFEAIHYYVTGSEFVQPAHVRMFSRAEMDALWTFRNQVDPTRPLQVRAASLGYTLDHWQVVDQSLNGFRVYRDPAGPRIEHGQLLGLKTADSDFYLLGQISWLMQETDGRLNAGIQVLPGRPQGICVRPAGAGVSPSEKYLRAFLLPAVPTLKEPASILLPRGWFSADRVIEMFTDRQVQVRLSRLLSSGTNFERCAFSAT